MECFELDIGGMAGNSQSRDSCGRRLLFPEKQLGAQQKRRRL